MNNCTRIFYTIRILKNSDSKNILLDLDNKKIYFIYIRGDKGRIPFNILSKISFHIIIPTVRRGIINMNVVKRNYGQWLFGLIILVIGIIFLLENLFGIEMWKNVWLFWPILLIIWGLMQLLQKRSIFFSIILLIIGTLFLLKNFQLYQWPDIIWKYWPLIIIAVGIDQLIKRPESYSSQSNQSFRKEKKKILTQDDEII